MISCSPSSTFAYQKIAGDARRALRGITGER
jgi:hypothetical protein